MHSKKKLYRRLFFYGVALHSIAYVENLVIIRRILIRNNNIINMIFTIEFDLVIIVNVINMSMLNVE